MNRFFLKPNTGFIVLFLAMIAFSHAIYAQNRGLVFTENKQQYPKYVLYKADLLGGTVFIEQHGLTYLFWNTPHPTIPELQSKHAHTPLQKNDSIKYHSYKVHFVNANENCQIIAQNPVDGCENYIKGNDPQKWSLNVKQYLNITYKNLWPNIDLVLYQNGNSFKYDFVVHPGGDPNIIKLRYEGIDSISVSQQNIILKTSINTIMEKKPYGYQFSKTGKDSIQTFYLLDEQTKMLSFRIYKYNKKETLFIDPELIFSTYTGSTTDNWGFTATYDKEGNVYSGGIVEGGGYPVSTGAYQKTQNADWDIGIIKYDPKGTKRLYATYLGGSGCEMPHSLVVNSKNELVLFGTSSSNDFPIKNGYKSTFSGGISIDYDNILFNSGLDIIVAILSPDGSNLKASTFLGGSDNDGLNYDNSIDPNLIQDGNGELYYNYGDGARGEVIVDQNDNVYVGTCTFSSDFPIVNGFQPTLKGGEEGVVFKLSADLKNLQWSSFLGGTHDDAIYSIDVDTAATVYVTGGTNSVNFPTTANTIHPNALGGAVDAFVTKISSNGSSILNSTYFGSSEYDQAYFVRVDKLKHIYIYGQTSAPGTTLRVNALYGQDNSGQFISKFCNTLDTLIWSTTFGTGVNLPNISPTAMSVDVCNRVYLSGVGREWPNWISLSQAIYNPATGYYEFGYDFTSIAGTKGMQLTSDAYQKITDGKDFYFMVMDENASSLDYATFFGEQHFGNYYYNPITGTYFATGCLSSGRDHVDGGTSRFDKVGNVYQSVCASCGMCQGFPTYPANVWSKTNNSNNCNNAVVVFSIHRDQIMANFKPVYSLCNPYKVTFTNTSTILDKTKITYTWDFGDGSAKVSEESPTHTYSKKGKYVVRLKIKDLTSCNFEDSVKYTIEINDTSNIIKLPDIILCENDSTILGSSLNTSSGATYKWTPSKSLSSDTVSHPTASPDTTTTYHLTVYENGCMANYEQTVTVFKETITISLQNINSDGSTNICYNEIAKLHAKTNQPYKSIIWSKDNQYKNLLTPLADSTIELTITHDTTIYVKVTSLACGIVAETSIKLTVIKPQMSVDNDTLICFGQSVQLSVKNENPSIPLLFEWSPEAYITNGQYTNQATVKPLHTGYITIKGTSAYGCSVTDKIMVTVDEVLTKDSKFTNISCHNKNDAEIEMIPSGIPPYLYVWENGQKTSDRHQLSEGNYYVTVTDYKGCSTIDTFIVVNPLVLSIDTTIYNTSCKQACNGAIITEVKGGTKPYVFQWNSGDTTASITNKCQGYYFSTVTDAHNCSLQYTSHIGMVEHLPELDASADKTMLYRSQKTKLHAIKTASDTVNYEWFPQLWLNNPQSAHPVATPDTTITYYVTATDQFGCMAIDTVTIFVRNFICNESYVFVPNVFTPNDDKKNDVLLVESKVIDSLHFVIYSRWGEKIFETTDINKGWDGTFHGKKLSPAVFVYYIEAICVDKQRFKNKGNISLLK